MNNKTDISKLELLLNVPKRYDNNFLSQKIEDQKIFVGKIVVNYLTKETKKIKAQARLTDFNINIIIIIFNYNQFHLSTYAKQSSFTIKGKIEYKFGTYWIINPKIVNDINKIISVYNTKSISKKIKDFDFDFLDNFFINKKYKNILFDIHFANQKMAKQFNDFGYTGIYLKALKFLEAYINIYKLSTKKISFKSKKKLLSDETKFIKSLPFKLTNDQLKAIYDIKNDFISDTASKRVIVGDVGCGKTMVILASLYMCYPNKSAVMAPTTILANQLYEEALKYLPDFNIVIATNNQKIDNSNYDIIISTHAILYMKDLPSFDLVIIDEQHRFGTKQREMLSNFGKYGKKRAHFLQFSATPIPRTFAMLQSSLVDYSFIKETPFDKNITTKIIFKNDFLKLKQHIKNEISNNRQIIIVYPLVEQSTSINYLSIQEAIPYWQREFSDVYYTYGKDKNKEDVLVDFKNSGSILISTTVIEVGISLPRLTTIVIVGAERLGLATLHQLRGRVSRNGLKGYCFLYTKIKNSARLKEFSKTKNGFDISELDLKYRDSGDLLGGTSQSGKEFRWLDMADDYDIVKEAKDSFTSYCL